MAAVACLACLWFAAIIASTATGAFPLQSPPTLAAQLERYPVPFDLVINNTFWQRDQNHTFPASVVQRISSFLYNKPQPPHFYPNLTAVFKGLWENSTAPQDKQVSNFSIFESLPETRGVVSFSWNSFPTSDLSLNSVAGNMRFLESKFVVQGMHFVQSGTILLIGSSQFSKMSLLPFLMPDEAFFSTAQRFVDDISTKPDYLSQLARFEEKQSRGSGSQQQRTLISCDFILVFQQSSLPSSVHSSDIYDLERELCEPAGIPTITPPEIELTGFLYSQFCPDIAMNMTVTGTRSPIFIDKTVHFAAFAAFATLIELFLTVQQMEQARFQLALSKLSLAMLGGQAVLDSYHCLLYLTTGIIFEKAFNQFAIIAFFKLILFSVFEMRLLMLVWKAQRPRNHDQETMRRELGSLYVLYYGSLVLGMVMFYQVHGAWIRWFTVLLFSFWIPQIVHNAQHNCRRPLNKCYVIGITFARMLVPSYLFFCPHNIFNVDPYPTIGFGFIIFLLAQLLVLLLQDVLGPRFIMFDKPSLPHHVYYIKRPVARIDAESAGPVEETMCVICMTAIDVTVTHMQTPCAHLFHSTCLETWMRTKLECPTCRTSLPFED